MLFHYSDLVPKNTTVDAPFHRQFKVMKGTIVEWILFQPEECADLVKFWVEFQGVQLLPYNREEWMYGFFQMTPVKESIELSAAPYMLDFFAVNDDDSYDHEYHVYVNIEPGKPVVPIAPGESGLFRRLQDFFGGL